MNTPEQGSLRKTLGLVTLFTLMCGAMLGMAWATLIGQLLAFAGPALILSVIIGAVFCIFIGLGYAELSSALPKVGGEHVFVTRALGRGWGFGVGWLLVLAYAAMMPGEVIIFSQVVKTLAPSIPVEVTGIVVALFFGLVNIIGVQLSALVQLVFAAALFTGMGVFIVAGIPHVDMANLQPFFGGGVAGMLAMVPVIMLAFMGFDILPQAVEEVKAPVKKAVLLIPLSIVFVGVFYLGSFFVGAGVQPWTMLVESTNPVPILEPAATVLGSAGPMIIIIAGVMGLITTLNGFLVGASRLMVGMAQDNVLPRSLGAINSRFGTPHVAIACLTVLGIAGAFFQQLLLIFQIASAAIAVSYLLVSVAVIALRRKEPGLERPYRVPGYPWITILAILGSLGAFVMALMFVDAVGLYIFAAWVLLGVVYYFAYVRRAGSLSRGPEATAGAAGR
ncbi:MAG: APC family permease [Chloroflexi bacterium]|nr:APC family permease [Chloroflexota bacterium]